MKRMAIYGVVLIPALLGVALVSKSRRQRLGAFVSGRMVRHMESMMASLPDTSPPKLVMTVLPRLREQNEEIIGLLQEQNALLRAALPSPMIQSTQQNPGET